MVLHTRAADVGLTHRHQHARDRAHEPAGLAPHRLRRAAEQGDRRAATPSRTSPASTRTACSRSARPTRSWTPTTVGVDDANSLVLGKHSGRHALRPALEELGYRGRRPGARTPRSSASRSWRTRRSRSRRWTSRRWSPTSCATSGAPTRSSGSTSRPPSRRPPHATVVDPHARRRDRAGRLHRRRPGRRDLPRDQRGDRASRRACASSASTRVTGGQDALGEASVILELAGPVGVRPGRLDRHHRGRGARLRARARPTPSARWSIAARGGEEPALELTPDAIERALGVAGRREHVGGGPGPSGSGPSRGCSRRRGAMRPAPRRAQRERLDAQRGARGGAHRRPRRAPSSGDQARARASRGRPGAASRFVGLQTPPSTYSRPAISTGAKIHGHRAGGEHGVGDVGAAARRARRTSTRRPLPRSTAAIRRRPSKRAPRRSRCSPRPPSGRCGRGAARSAAAARQPARRARCRPAPAARAASADGRAGPAERRAARAPARLGRRRGAARRAHAARRRRSPASRPLPGGQRGGDDRARRGARRSTRTSRKSSPAPASMPSARRASTPRRACRRRRSTSTSGSVARVDVPRT